jgi:hypothetical protein
MINFKDTIKKHLCILFIVIFANITIHEVCKSYGCDHWTTIFGHNIICNYCLDYLKAIKDYQFMLYGSIITSLTLQITQITEVIKSGNRKEE